MALRQLLLGKKIEGLNAQVEEKRASNTDFEVRRAAISTREKELEAAVAEMTAETPDEDRQTVETEVEQLEQQSAELEQEQQENNEQVAGLEEQIRTLQAELDEMNQRAENHPQAPAENQPEERKDDKHMENRTKFFGMSMTERDAFMAREDVKGFLTRVREFAKQTRSVTGADLTIPEVMLPLIRELTEKYSKLIGKVRFKTLNGTARELIAGTIPEGVWTEMAGKINELTFGFNQVEADGYKVAGYIPVSNSILEDSDVALATEILDVIGQAIGYAVDKAIVYGTGSKMPLGIVTRLAQTSEPSGYSSKARPWVDLHTTNVLAVRGGTSGSYTELEGIELFKGIAKAAKAAKGKYSQGGKFWLMSEATHQDITIAGMSVNAAGAVVSGVQSTMPVLGGDIIELDFIPDGEIIYGYADEYLLVQRKGVQLSQSEHVLFVEDQTVFKGTARYDGLPVIAEGFVAMAIDAGEPTTSATFAADSVNP